jgi:hypothetical protein
MRLVSGRGRGGSWAEEEEEERRGGNMGQGGEGVAAREMCFETHVVY